MARRRGDKPTPQEKGSRSEPNLELPSFRLSRRKQRSEPAGESVPPAEKPVARPRRPPAPPRSAPPTPPAPPVAAAAQQPQAKPVAPKRRPPAPPRSDEVLVPKRVPKPPASVEAPAKHTPKPKEPKRRQPPRARREPKTSSLSWLPGWLAAILTGAACGALTVVLAWATAQGCDAVRGVGTCGGFGVIALVAILGIDVVVASGLLRLFRVTDPTTTSVLGVGLVAVSAMLFFLKDTQSQAMVYVIPVLMAVTFALSWWVTQAISSGPEA